MSSEFREISARFLSEKKRCTIADLRRGCAKLRQIGAELAPSPSTISRELRRNTEPTAAVYRPVAAHRLAAARRSARRGRRVDRDRVLCSFIQERLAGLKYAGPTQSSLPSPPLLPATALAGDQLHRLEFEHCDELAHQIGRADSQAMEALGDELVALRTERRLPVASWSTRGLVAALQLSLQRGWPADRAIAALRQVAADPPTRSPMRMAEAGPWRDPPATPGLRRTRQEDDELERLEEMLAERDDRAWLQSRARADLLTSGQTVDRLSVARRATRLAEQNRIDRGDTE